MGGEGTGQAQNGAEVYPVMNPVSSHRLGFTSPSSLIPHQPCNIG